jgi:hypothetical protein
MLFANPLRFVVIRTAMCSIVDFNNFGGAVQTRIAFDVRLSLGDPAVHLEPRMGLGMESECLI